MVQELVNIERLGNTHTLSCLESGLKVLSRIVLNSQLLIVDLVRHARVHESTKRETVIPTATKILNINALVVAHSLLAPFHERISFAHTVLFNEIGQSIRVVVVGVCQEIGASTVATAVVGRESRR